MKGVNQCKDGTYVIRVYRHGKDVYIGRAKTEKQAYDKLRYAQRKYQEELDQYLSEIEAENRAAKIK